MGQGRRHFADEFKQEAIALLVNSGRPLSQIAIELGISPSMLRNWRNGSRGRDAGSALRPIPASAPHSVRRTQDRVGSSSARFSFKLAANDELHREVFDEKAARFKRSHYRRNHGSCRCFSDDDRFCGCSHDADRHAPRGRGVVRILAPDGVALQTMSRRWRQAHRVRRRVQGKRRQITSAEQEVIKVSR